MEIAEYQVQDSTRAVSLTKSQRDSISWNVFHDEASVSNFSQKSLLSKVGGVVFSQLLALLVLVGFPALVTAFAPVSYIRFSRHDDQVRGTVQTCLFFFIPYKTTTVQPVLAIDDRSVEGTIRRERRPGRDRQIQSEDQGFLVIRGVDAEAEVQVTPANLKSVVERSQAFLNDRQTEELELFVVANWKFSVIMGGLVSLLTVIYVLTLGLGLLLKLVHLFQWALGVPPEQRLFAKLLRESKAIAKTRPPIAQHR